MRKLIITLFVGLILTGCQMEPDSQAQNNSETAQTFLEVVLTDPNQAAALMHDEFVFELMAELPLYTQRHSPLRRYYDKETYFSLFLESVGTLLPEGISLTPIEVIASDDKVAITVRGESQALHGAYNNQYVFVFTFQEGKIIELREYLSDVLVAESLFGNTLVPTEYTGAQYVEYFWHSEGDNYSDEALESLIVVWNDLIDGIQCPMNGASILRPREEQSEYDLVWMVSWPSQDVRAQCFERWGGEAQDQWAAALDGVLIPTDSGNGGFLFKTEIGKLPKAWNETNEFVHSYFFCNLNEGLTQNDLHNYRTEVNQITEFSDHAWYMLLEPEFEMETPYDFIWTDMWPTEEERETDLDLWNATDLPDMAMNMATCGDSGISGLTFDGVVIREGS